MEVSTSLDAVKHDTESLDESTPKSSTVCIHGWSVEASPAAEIKNNQCRYKCRGRCGCPKCFQTTHRSLMVAWGPVGLDNCGIEILVPEGTCWGVLDAVKDASKP
jgi:hypothetical protein